MAFWGIEIKPSKPYIHRYEEECGRLHVSLATLGNCSSTKKSIVQCNVGDKKPIYLCSLLPEKLETCPLNLEFEEEDEVTFSIIGPHSVHLSGFFYGDSQEKDDYGSDSYGEDIAETGSESGESSKDDSEDEYDEGFIDDDLEMFPTSPVPNSGVRIEEILDEEKPANDNGMPKQSKKKNNQRGVSDDNDNLNRQMVVKSGSAVPVLESEDEDGFPISSPVKSKTNALNSTKAEEVKDSRPGEETKKKAKDEPSRAKGLKRKTDGTVPDYEQTREETDVAPEINDKQKKNKKKKVSDKKEKAHEDVTSSKATIQPEEATMKEKAIDIDTNSIADENHFKEKKKKKKNKKKSKKPESVANVNMEEIVSDKNVSTTKTEEKAEAKPFQVRTFPNGLVIEELKMGKPDGKKASPGKKVSVHYIGKLKKTGKIFDSNIGKAPFKFRLGVGQVIKGWDVGVNGMRVGDKRRLTIPPAMGYGAQGAGGAIPPNAWLVFDVEFVDVS